ncbi:MAG: radical SAM/SPASM domain-containing protein [Desulfoprunum sp.]
MDSLLSELTIEIIQKCANCCLFCSSLSSREAKHIIAREDIIEIGRQAKALGLKDISLSGGEPLLHPNIEEIVSTLVSLDLRVSIYTTGIVFDFFETPESFERWNNFDKKAVKLIFGVQSSDETVHDKITRHPGSFYLTKKSIFAAKKDGFTVEVHIVPNRINLSTLESSVEDFISWGIDKVSLLRIVAQGFARIYKNLLIPNQNDAVILREIILKIEEKFQKSGKLRIGIPFSGYIENPKYCNAGESKLIIRYDGKALPCEAFKDESFNEFILGDIKDSKIEVLLSKSKTNIKLSNLKLRITGIETCPAQFLYI